MLVGLELLSLKSFLLFHFFMVFNETPCFMDNSMFVDVLLLILVLNRTFIHAFLLSLMKFVSALQLLLRWRDKLVSFLLYFEVIQI